MGKIRKNNIQTSRHNPLDQQILEGNLAQASSRTKIRSKQLKDNNFVDNKHVNEILKLARRQQESIEETKFFHSNSAHLSLSSNDRQSEDSVSHMSIHNIKEEITNINEDDKEDFEKFKCEDPVKRVALGEDTKDTLTEKQTEMSSVQLDEGSQFGDIDKLSQEHRSTRSFEHRCTRTVEHSSKFQQLAPELKTYHSGKLPELFKDIPKFSNWEQALNLTEPDNWSSATMYQATRLFSSNLQDKMAQRFYNLFLLPRLRKKIAESKDLRPGSHLYAALKKTLYKPAAFFKGIMIPLCEADADCTEREATVIGSVLDKCSIPVLHLSAALLTLIELEYSDLNSFFIRKLLEKQYPLTDRVINALVDHFLKFMDDTSKECSLKWHQCLLTFVEIYKFDLSLEQTASILKLLTVHTHEKITPKIRKKLEEKPDLNEIMQQMWKIEKEVKNGACINDLQI